MPAGVTCNGFENYIYTAPGGAAVAPYASALRIPAAPGPADNSLQYIPGNLFVTLNDPQTLTGKTIDCHLNTCLNFTGGGGIGALPGGNSGDIQYNAGGGLFGGYPLSSKFTTSGNIIDLAPGVIALPGAVTGTITGPANSGSASTYMRSDAVLPLSQTGVGSGPFTYATVSFDAYGRALTASSGLTPFAVANNLSEGNPTAMRAALGITSIGTAPSPLPVATGGTGATTAGATAANNIGAFAVANNLSEGFPATMRTNLGLGSMATQSANAVNITGAALVTGLPAPVNPSDAARLADVQAAASGITPHTAVAAATTAALSGAWTYANGTAGVGATLTAPAGATTLTVDGYTVLNNDRLLIQNQASAFQNGVYVATISGSPVVLTRAADFNTAVANNLAYGATTQAANGTVNFKVAFFMNTTGTITIGTTAINWVVFLSPATGVTGPGSSVDSCFPTWNGTTGTTLRAGVCGVTTATANSVVETGAGGTINNNFLNAIPNLALANPSLTIGTTNIPLGTTAPTIAGVAFTNPSINGGTLSGIFTGTYTFTGIPKYTGLSAGSAVTELGLDSGNNLITFTPGADTITTGITAAGTNNTNCTQLTTQFNVVASVLAATGVCLPSAGPGSHAIVRNSGANPLFVYGKQADSAVINTGTPPTVIQPNHTTYFEGQSLTQWFSID